MISLSFSLKTQTSENDARTTTDYSKYLDAQIIDFHFFFTVFNRFHCFRVDDLKRYENDTKTMYGCNTDRFH